MACGYLKNDSEFFVSKFYECYGTRFFKEKMQELHERFLSAKRRLFDKVFAKGLNPEQCRAVFTAKGPLLVLAGAGSGKTTVLINRIVNMIKY